MKLQKQPDANCLVYAAAMVLGIDAECLLAMIGHRGQKVAWPELAGQHSMVGVHIQEIQDAYAAYGWGLVEIQIAPCVMPRSDATVKPYVLWDEVKCESRFKAWIGNREAILTGVMPNGVGHAVAWDGNLIYDPAGRICRVTQTDLLIQSAWIKSKLI